MLDKRFAAMFAVQRLNNRWLPARAKSTSSASVTTGAPRFMTSRPPRNRWRSVWGGQPFVVIMRTPGADRDLAAGFLLSEQLIQRSSDVSMMRYCADADGRDSENILNVWLQGEASVRAQAAALFDAAGALTGIAEDVGRHNAVDKVIGAAFGRRDLPLSERLQFVSGRTSFEIVQKAVVAGIPIVAAVSAPSSLAIDLAREANVTLLGS